MILPMIKKSDDSRIGGRPARRSVLFVPGSGRTMRASYPRPSQASQSGASGRHAHAGGVHCSPHDRWARMATYAFNGQAPGPLIRVQQGTTFFVRFRNEIDRPATIHWHGIRLANASDGSP